MAVGPNDLKQFTIPSLWDASYLEKYRLVDGTTYEGLVAEMAVALAIANADLMSDPLYAGLISTTELAALEYEVGVSNGFSVHTEYSQPDAGRGATSGHMLPLIGYDRKLSWTWDFLRKARQEQITADISSAVRDLKNLWAQRILTRLFKSDSDSVASGYSVPLADGGAADTSYVPLAVPDRGGTFLYTHDHISYASGINQTNLETALENLWEHDYDSPFDLLISEADIADWTNTTNVTGWIPRADPSIRYGATADLANVDPGYLGVIETDFGAARVRATGRIPTTYWSAYKSYGSMDERNPLAVRLPNGAGDMQAVCRLLQGDHIREFPLENALLFAEFGVGVRDRVGAVVMRNNGSSYVTPTIS
jgi:hypothetical protein